MIESKLIFVNKCNDELL
uniref:Uncharacterized protein n=1 Tax=Rhizophora mucronata TaxID=61149 RepID=A0A2P2P0U9_RHIMU